MEELILETKQITEDWLSHILKTRGYLVNGKVLKIRNIKEIKRYVSKSYYFDVEYSKPVNHSLAKKYFLKVYETGLNEELMGTKEVEFYNWTRNQKQYQ